MKETFEIFLFKSFSIITLKAYTSKKNQTILFKHSFKCHYSLYLTLPIEDCTGLLWCLGEILLAGDGDLRTGD
jgi:hypothetical protein